MIEFLSFFVSAFSISIFLFAVRFIYFASVSLWVSILNYNSFVVFSRWMSFTKSQLMFCGTIEVCAGSSRYVSDESFVSWDSPRAVNAGGEETGSQWNPRIMSMFFPRFWWSVWLIQSKYCLGVTAKTTTLTIRVKREKRVVNWHFIAFSRWNNYDCHLPIHRIINNQPRSETNGINLHIL